LKNLRFSTQYQLPKAAMKLYLFMVIDDILKYAFLTDLYI